jgi:hypothetical protein
MRFDIVFGFRGSSGPIVQSQIRRFLRESMQLVRPYSKGSITYEVLSVEVSGLELTCRLDVVPAWPAAARLSDSELTHMGITHPARARATTALLLWIASLHGSDPLMNPLIHAWREFTGDSAATFPLILSGYEYRVSPPVTRKSDSRGHDLTPAKYDGTTTSRARVF